MRVFNETQIPTKSLELLLDFLQGFLPQSHMAHFVFRAQEAGKKSITGLATGPGWGLEQSSPWPAMVEVWVTEPSLNTYPHHQQYVPDLPVLLIRSWEEELVLVLAHELAHVDQFADGKVRDLYQLELEAEGFAYEALFAWRARRPDRRCRITRKAA